jgi:hypothetical protein
MIIRTRVFDIAGEKYENLSELARVMGISVSQVYRVREGKRGINEKFIIGAKMDFPDLRLDELLYFNSDQQSRKVPKNTVNQHDSYIVERLDGGDGSKKVRR